MHHFQILALVYYIISGATELFQISLGKLGLVPVWKHTRQFWKDFMGQNGSAVDWIVELIK